MVEKIENKEIYDVVIVGGGVTGSALLYVLAHFTDMRQIALIEKYNALASVNSSSQSNSQTLHFGDIETNYTREKAIKVNESSKLVAAYLEKYAPEAFYLTHKMVLAVGKEEVAQLRQRFEEFSDVFPKLKKLERAQIAQVEPNVVKDRREDEEIFALINEDGYTVDYQKLSESFVKKARETDKLVEVFLGEEVGRLERDEEAWRISTPARIIRAKTVVVSTGPHSLIFAKKLGYGTELGLLPVAGSFYRAYNVLKGKVYMMQLKKLPFAAVHGDPEVHNPAETRFGPTAKVLPLLERHHYGTMLDFFKTSAFTVNGILSLFNIILDKTILLYVLKNLAFDLPWFGKWLFLQDAKKIVPGLEYADLTFGKGLGGIRPQIVNTKTKKLEMGEAKLVGEKIIFNITPSPGASVCLQNAFSDALLLEEFAEGRVKFDQEAFKKELSLS